jgi:STAS-like domain of unknown function (DUF4325)
MTMTRPTDKLVINFAGDFTRFPAGRYRADGRFSGERFRDEFLVPAMLKAKPFEVNLDGTMGFGSSFLEEAFGGLARDARFNAQSILSLIELRSRDQSIVDEIKRYISDAG